MSTLIKKWRRKGDDLEAGWLEDDIPLLKEHGLFANESDDVGLEQLKGQTKLKYLRLSNDKGGMVVICLCF